MKPKFKHKTIIDNMSKINVKTKQMSFKFNLPIFKVIFVILNAFNRLIKENINKIIMQTKHRIWKMAKKAAITF